MTNRGEIVRTAIEKSGFSKRLLAERLKISRGTLYTRFNEMNLSWEFISEVGKIINHDFSIEFPELRKKTYIINEELAQASEEDPDNYTLPDCKKKLEQMRIKYIALFEKYAELLEKKAS